MQPSHQLLLTCRLSGPASRRVWREGVFSEWRVDVVPLVRGVAGSGCDVRHAHADIDTCSRWFSAIHVALPATDLQIAVQFLSRCSNAIDVPEDMGMRYGKVSGDLNIVHTTALAARLFGHEGAFIQGLCTANYVLVRLAAASELPLQSFRISFAQRVFVGTRVELLFKDKAFEVLDDKAGLLAFGDFERAPAP